MRSFLAFLYKEFIEGIRSKKTIIILVIMGIFGVMNPLFAKITPQLMEAMADSFEKSGMQIANIEVDALTSWQQFFKNIPMGLLAFVLLFGGTFTNEYDKKTLINVVTKGLSRWKIVTAKTVHLVVIWTIGIVGCSGITALYNQIYWDNGIANNLVFSIVLYWLFGCSVIMLFVLASTLCNSNGTVLATTAVCIMIVYMVSIWEKAAKFLPTKLCDGMLILEGTTKPEDYMVSVIVSCLVIVVSFVIGIIVFNKKEL